MYPLKELHENKVTVSAYPRHTHSHCMPELYLSCQISLVGCCTRIWCSQRKAYISSYLLLCWRCCCRWHSMRVTTSPTRTVGNSRGQWQFGIISVLASVWSGIGPRSITMMPWWSMIVRSRLLVFEHISVNLPMATRCRHADMTYQIPCVFSVLL